MTKEYRLREEIPQEIDKILTPYPTLTRKLLFHRNIDNVEEAERFFNPDYNLDLHDPFLLYEMDKAVERLLKAIEKKEKIVIYSDYDADGIPGAVILREFIEALGHREVENYIPHRHLEGYGLHMDAIESLAKGKTELIITVDCGTADYEQVKLANSLGMDVVITDHHELNGKLPEALALINPKHPQGGYPFDGLCGAGVVFKLIQAVLSKGDFDFKDGREKWFLDLVGVATLSDMVPLVDENRALSFFGLKVLQKSPRPGLQKLWKKLGVLQKNLREDDITFSLAPRINAASRMDHPMDAFKLLATKDEAEADVLSDHLNKINDERKGVVASMVKEIKKQLEKRGELSNIVVLGNPNWKPSLLGLAANSIMDDIGKPIFLWGRNGDNELKGSCRSEGKTNVFSLMGIAENSFSQFGGHKMAGGFSVERNKVHTLELDLNVAFDKMKKSEDTSTFDSKSEYIDDAIVLDDINWNFYNQIAKFSPFGVGNPKPTFLLRGVIPKILKQFGKEKNHMEIVFENSNGNKIKAISFFSSPEKFSKTPKEGVPINLIASIENSTFRSYLELRLRIVDII